MMLMQRRAMFALTEEGMAVVVRKGARACRKITRDIDAAYAGLADRETLVAAMAVEAQAVLRARCGLCPFRSKCKGPLL